MKYWDSSALVALVLDEPRSTERRATIRCDPVIVTWWGSRIECASALNRVERDGRFEGDGLDRSLDRLELLAGSWIEIEPLEQVRKRAIRLLRLHPLRPADALQLAAALTAAGEDPQRLDLVSSDDRLSAAARREGFRVL
ncbi:MAG: type II toxin-antitoxin system VapC family toxin [Gemmatimonadales bacterium]|nr:type II toxin-antitoxin system VapC family toxin [Gemmatimonadales bacterium]MYG50228.1 type II toxin-antitoxin system VapC family toxin [Gemmatimonadales bacterium]MYK02640.1 type II toxin-antitoxin system VapC family toxin [Candidatus Palauibacter ramosifaciens]